MSVRTETTRLSSKGQIVLPGSIRRAHHWQPGTEFMVQETPEGVLLKPLTRSVPASCIEDVAGCLKSRRTRVSLSDMTAAIADEARKRHARGRY